MPAREFKNRADYYSCIIESADKKLATDPNDILHREVTKNISGGHYMWDEGADQMFSSPQDLEEGLLALELERVLMHAIENQKKSIYLQLQENRLDLGALGIPMDFSLLFSTASTLSKRNPFLAMLTKIELSNISKYVGKSGILVVYQIALLVVPRIFI